MQASCQHHVTQQLHAGLLQVMDYCGGYLGPGATTAKPCLWRLTCLVREGSASCAADALHASLRFLEWRTPALPFCLQKVPLLVACSGRR